jgi:hypothetical protein
MLAPGAGDHLHPYRQPSTAKLHLVRRFLHQVARGCAASILAWMHAGNGEPQQVFLASSILNT